MVLKAGALSTDGEIDRLARGHADRAGPLPFTVLNLGIFLALLCAVVTQLGFLYKHKGANEAARVDMRHPLRSVKELFSSKWFAIGMAVATSAWFFHVAALAFAPMSGVQAVLSTGVVLLAV